MSAPLPQTLLTIQRQQQRILVIGSLIGAGIPMLIFGGMGIFWPTYYPMWKDPGYWMFLGVIGGLSWFLSRITWMHTWLYQWEICDEAQKQELLERLVRLRQEAPWGHEIPDTFERRTPEHPWLMRDWQYVDKLWRRWTRPWMGAWKRLYKATWLERD